MTHIHMSNHHSSLVLDNHNDAHTHEHHQHESQIISLDTTMPYRGIEMLGQLSEAYMEYLAKHRASKNPSPLMSPSEFEAAMHAPTNQHLSFMDKLKDLAQKVTQTCRLMVGVHDYEIYLQHMKMHHPDLPALNRADFYKYCLDARFGANGNINKCPC